MGKTVEATNFKAWKMLEKLGTDAIPASRQKSITANDIASRLLRAKGLRTSPYKKDESSWKKENIDRQPNLSRNFSLDELETALMSLKPGKAAGFDGIHPEFIKKFGA
jgi:hypothetical protein